jgi:ABC-type multidrug transport system fused ATPase/permease subunit
MLIREAVESLHIEKTIVMITHQFSLVKRSDRILVLKGGEIVEWGTHVELLDLRGCSPELLQRQGQ